MESSQEWKRKRQVPGQRRSQAGLREETGLDPEGKVGEERGGGERDQTSHPTTPPSRGEGALQTPQFSLRPVHLQTGTQRQPAT